MDQGKHALDMITRFTRGKALHGAGTGAAKAQRKALPGAAWKMRRAAPGGDAVVVAEQ